MLASVPESKRRAGSLSQLHGICRQSSQLLFAVFRLVLIIGISYIILFPILMKISSSFMGRKDLVDQTVKWIPKNLTLDNYRLAIATLKFPVVFKNSLQLSVLVSILQLFSSMLVGYGLARFDFRGKSLIFGAAIFTLIITSDDDGSPLPQLEVLQSLWTHPWQGVQSSRQLLAVCIDIGVWDGTEKRSVHPCYEAVLQRYAKKPRRGCLC